MAGDRVTLKDVYDIVSRLEDKIDTRLVSLEQKVDELYTRVSEAEGKAKTLAWIIPVFVTVALWVLNVLFGQNLIK